MQLELEIDVALKVLIPPLADDEYSRLEKSIVAEGCRDAIVVWNGIIVDGHNRYAICNRHGINFRIVDAEFATKQDAMVWMIDNQLSRRNLPDFCKCELVSKKKEILLAAGEERMKEGGSKHVGNQYTGGEVEGLSIVDKPSIAEKTKETHNTQKTLAKDLDWSTGKVAMAEVVMKKADEVTKEKLRKAEISINQAYVEIKKAERTEEIQTHRQGLIKKAESVKVSDRWNVFHSDIGKWQAPRQYDFIITDPPYPKEYLHLWEVLAKRASEWLKEGGLLIAMSGQSYLDEIYPMLCRHLNYYWTCAYLTPGQPTPLRQVNVNSTWKPLLVFSKGKYTGKIFGDVFKSDGNDKENHKWGQSVSGMKSIVSGICLSGQHILDPFCGAGTTGIAALSHGCFFDGVEIEIENVNISKVRLHDTAT